MNDFVLIPTQKSLVGSFDNYKIYVKNIPDLTVDEEVSLVNRLNSYANQSESMESAKKLIMSQLKNVVKIAEQHKGYGIPTEDLVQEGNIGLMKAVKSYKIGYNTRLYTYALIWIKSEIQSYILKNWKIVKAATTNNLKKLFFNFRSTQNELISSGVPKDEVIQSIAKKLDVSISDVRDMQSYLMGSDVSLELEYEQEDSKSTILQLPDYSSPDKIYEKTHDSEKISQMLRDNLNKLNEKQKKVIELKYLTEDSKTNKDVANILGISAERVRQLEVESLKKLRESMLIS